MWTNILIFNNTHLQRWRKYSKVFTGKESIYTIIFPKFYPDKLYFWCHICDCKFRELVTSLIRLCCLLDLLLLVLSMGIPRDVKVPTFSNLLWIKRNQLNSHVFRLETNSKCTPNTLKTTPFQSPSHIIYYIAVVIPYFASYIHTLQLHAVLFSFEA